MNPFTTPDGWNCENNACRYHGKPRARSEDETPRCPECGRTMWLHKTMSYDEFLKTYGTNQDAGYCITTNQSVLKSLT